MRGGGSWDRLCPAERRSREAWAGRKGPLSPPLRGAARRARLLPLGSSACLASLRSAAAKLEDGAAWADSALLVAGLPLGTRAPLSGEGVRGLTVAVVLVAVESIPSEGDLGSWLMPETGKEEPEVTQRAGGPGTGAGSARPGGPVPVGGMRGAGAEPAAPAAQEKRSRASAAQRTGARPRRPRAAPPSRLRKRRAAVPRTPVSPDANGSSRPEPTASPEDLRASRQAWGTETKARGRCPRKKENARGKGKGRTTDDHEDEHTSARPSAHRSGDWWSTSSSFQKSQQARTGRQHRPGIVPGGLAGALLCRNRPPLNSKATGTQRVCTEKVPQRRETENTATCRPCCRLARCKPRLDARRPATAGLNCCPGEAPFPRGSRFRCHAGQGAATRQE